MPVLGAGFIIASRPDFVIGAVICYRAVSAAAHAHYAALYISLKISRPAILLFDSRINPPQPDTKCRIRPNQPIPTHGRTDALLNSGRSCNCMMCARLLYLRKAQGCVAEGYSWLPTHIHNCAMLRVLLSKSLAYSKQCGGLNCGMWYSRRQRNSLQLRALLSGRISTAHCLSTVLPCNSCWVLTHYSYSKLCCRKELVAEEPKAAAASRPAVWSIFSRVQVHSIYMQHGSITSSFVLCCNHQTRHFLNDHCRLVKIIVVVVAC